MSMHNHPYVAVQQQQQAPHLQQQQAFYPVVIGNQAPQQQQQQQQAFFQPPQPQSTSSTSTTPQQPLYTEVPIRHSCSFSRFSCSVRNFFRGGNNGDGQKCRFIQLFQVGLILYIVATLLSFFFRRSSTFTLGNLICGALGLFALHKKNDVLMAVFTGLMTYKTLANIVGCFSGSLFYMSNYGYYYYRFSWMVFCVVVFELVATVAGWAYVRRAFFKRGCAHHQNATAADATAAVVVEGPTVSDLIHNAQQENEHVVIPESQLQRLNVVEQPVLQASSSPINVPSVYPQATPSSPVMMMQQQQQPSVPQQQAPSTPFIYGTQMEVLRSMGFLDEQKNAHMLMKHNGDISSAVREIISV